MALSEDVIKQQIDILATKTSDNPEMIYKTIAALNKGLDPNYFSGHDSKIVNAINKLASEVKMLNQAVVDLANKHNEVIMDIHSEENEEIWEMTQKLMGENNLIEGIKSILEGRQIENILDLHPADEGKILTVDINQDGQIEIKPLHPDAITVEVGSYDVSYASRDFTKLNSVGEAIDFILEDMQQPLQWDELVNKPKLADDLLIENEELVLKSVDDDKLAVVPITNDEDINNIINSLDI